MKERELIVYKDFEDGALLNDMVYLMDNYKDEKADTDKLKSMFYSCFHKLLELAGHFGFYGNLWHCYLSNLLVNNENSYSMACEIVGEVTGTINDCVLHDMEILKELYDYDFTDMTTALGIRDFNLALDYTSSSRESKVYNTRICSRIVELAKKFNENNTPAEMKQTLTAFYKDYGVGRFGLHKAFRIEHTDNGANIIPITNIAHVSLDDLIGYEDAKKKLIDNTEAFVQGRVANNCLLFGDAGTGKSSSIKAIANKYYEDGLRIIEVYKHQFVDLNDVIAQIKNRNYKFILYMDDLSFETFETEYKYLKAVIEGGLEKKPKNVLIYATSNRRHLVNEKFSERGENAREDEVHFGDTMQEKLSLYNRFGVTIYFGSPDKKQYNNIVTELAKREGLDIDNDKLLLLANKWELAHGGMTGRTAVQFINYLKGTGNI
ncbi:MAG: ATP-binding protein [Lachnospiraceae bacterium]|jgi:predicted AAA+ superfamily ATPase|nr:ATP-binding protein [Lachnospiraceae bacterium]